MVPLPPCSPGLNSLEAIGDRIREQIGNALWEWLTDLKLALGEELRWLWESAAAVWRSVSHSCLIERANVTAAENSTFRCQKW